MMKVTIRDIAAACGVSTATVSRALAGKANPKSDTYRNIVQCAYDLGYVYKQKQVLYSSHKVMVIVGDISNPFFSSIVQTFSALMSKHGYYCSIFVSNDNPAEEEHFIRYAYDNNFSVIVMLTAVETPELINLIAMDVCPIIMINRFIRTVDMSVVSTDNIRGGYIATRHLIERGHRKIAHLAGPQNSTASEDRTTGYCQALKDWDLPHEDHAIYYGDLSFQSGYKFGSYFMQNLKDYTAVFCANDAMALGFVSYLDEAGLKVGEDISLVCYDDTTLLSHTGRNLTAVAQDVELMSEAAADIVHDLISGRPDFKKHIIFPPTIRERNSVKNLNK